MEYNYLGLLNEILTKGNDKTDRTGVGTRSLFGAQLRYNLADNGFPLLTTKKIYTRAVFGELCWLMRGDTNIKWLTENNIHIWDEWADANGDLGPVYGHQWRHWAGQDAAFHGEIDQLSNALDLIKNQPDSRRIVVTAWQPADLSRMALSPCHMTFQFEVHEVLGVQRLSCHMYMRSADVFLGVPFNIASYAALTHVMAYLSGLEVGDLIVSFGDVHIYKNHFDQVKEQLTREPRPFPELLFKPKLDATFDNIEIEDFQVFGYDPHPAIKAPVAV